MIVVYTLVFHPTCLSTVRELLDTIELSVEDLHGLLRGVIVEIKDEGLPIEQADSEYIGGYKKTLIEWSAAFSSHLSIA